MLLSNLNLLATAPDGVAKLRELILTLAVRGKLVPQDPSDEPASVLLKKIRAEKDRLIAEGKIKRDKPLAEIAEEEKPFELPQGWEWVRLPEIYYSISPSGSKLLSSAVGEEGDHPVVDQGQRPIAGYTNDRSLLIEIPGPVIIFGDHTKAIKHIDFDFVAGADGTKILRPVLQDERFFAHQLRSFTLEDRGYARHFKVLNSHLFALPPLAEQSRIVTRVEELMRLCDALQDKARLEATQHAQLVATLLGTLTAASRAGAPDASASTPGEPADPLHARWQRVAPHFDLLLDRPEAVDALEQTILQLAVRGHLVPQDPQDEPASALLKKIRAEKDKLIAEGKIKRNKPPLPIAKDELPFALPQGWEWVRMGALGAAFDYGTSQKSIDDSSAVPVLRMGNIQAGRVVMKNLKYLVDREGDLPALLLQKDDLLFNRTNSYDLVGKTGLFEGFHREVTFASYLIRVKLMEGLVSPQYVDMYMNTRDCRVNEIEPDLTQQTGQANYNGTKLKSIRIPLPPFAEQFRIVTRVAQLRRLCADLRQRLTASQSTQAHLAEALVQEVA